MRDSCELRCPMTIATAVSTQTYNNFERFRRGYCYVQSSFSDKDTVIINIQLTYIVSSLS